MALKKLKEERWSSKAAAGRKHTKAFYKGIKHVYGPEQCEYSPIFASNRITLLIRVIFLIAGKNTLKTFIYTGCPPKIHFLTSINLLNFFFFQINEFNLI